MGRVVLKLGGRVAAAAAVRTHAWLDEGDEVVVVHGAGPQITSELEARGIVPAFVSGRRLTTPDVLEVVRASMSTVNAEVCAAIGPLAVGLFGDEIGLRALQVTELGLVGEPEPSAPGAVLATLAAGRVPVVAPLAAGPDGAALNVNADEAAAALAVGLGADRIAFVSDVPGVYLGDAVVPLLAADEADRLLGAGRFEGGIVPKLMAAISCAREGVGVEIGSTKVVA